MEFVGQESVQLENTEGPFMLLETSHQENRQDVNLTCLTISAILFWRQHYDAPRQRLTVASCVFVCCKTVVK